MKYILLITSLLVIGFSTLVSVPGSPYLIGGMTQADISAMHPTQITPAGITFAIWSVIYASWILVGIYFAFFAQASNSSEERILSKYAFAIFLSAVWLIPWGFNMVGIACMILLMIFGLMMDVFLSSRKSHPILKWSIELTFGWINIAVLANMTIWLISIGFIGNSIPEKYWTIGALSSISLFVFYYQFRYRAYIISFVFFWAAYGIWIAHPNLEVILAFWSSLICMSILYSFWKK
ncbi:MAG: tryptophan-rich sensory protein [Candidatus Gracilibacteria bacterium]|nr:tryptophan-rich sensory protein [Candidatus Gracilibacteria bacterium]